MTHPDPEHLTTIFVGFLTGNGPGLEVGYGEAPEGAAYPYLVVSPLGPDSIEGSLAKPNEIQTVEWQVTAVGPTAQSAEGGVAAARDTIIGASIDFTAAGYKQTGAVKLNPGPTFSADDDQPRLFMSSESYRVVLVPT